MFRNLLTAVVFLLCFSVQAQVVQPVSTATLAADLKILIQINTTPHLIDLSGKEAVELTHATPEQVIEITAPYLNSTLTNAKWICFDFLGHVVLNKATMLSQRQKTVEVICGNYFNNSEELQIIDNTLLQLNAIDFNEHSRQYIAALMDSVPRLDYNICAKISAIAQVTASIPALWRIANQNIPSLSRSDIDVLAALARMQQSKAGSLLCSYYNSTKNSKDLRHVFASRDLAFSLDSNVLACLIADFKTIDTAFVYRDGDTGFYPSQVLAGSIVSMLQNYPYSKETYNVKPGQLMRWLAQTKKLELKTR